MMKLIDNISFFIGNILPESKFKNSLRKIYHGFFNKFYDLNKTISYTRREGKILLVELNQGLKFYGEQEKILSPKLKYGNPRKLSKINHLEYFNSFLSILHEQYVDDIYEKHYKMKSGDIVVDIGANIGVFTGNAAKAVTEAGKVIAIEPEANNVKVLNRNIVVNGARNVMVTCVKLKFLNTIDTVDYCLNESKNPISWNSFSLFAHTIIPLVNY